MGCLNQISLTVLSVYGKYYTVRISLGYFGQPHNSVRIEISKPYLLKYFKKEKGTFIFIFIFLWSSLEPIPGQL